MFVQATISCKCGCISRIEFQAGKHAYVCPNCKTAMNADMYSKLEKIMCDFGDWNTDVIKNPRGLNEPEMRAVTISIADLGD